MPFLENREFSRISMEIERQIKRDRKKSLDEVKILVLGTAESGKSTFTKQMKVIQGKGFDTLEREEARKTILSNLLTSTCIILKCYISDLKKTEEEQAEKLLESLNDQSPYAPMKEFISKRFMESVYMITFWGEKYFPKKEHKQLTNYLLEYSEELLNYLSPEEEKYMYYYLRQFLGEGKINNEGRHLHQNERRLELLRCVFDEYKFTELLLSWNMVKLPDSALYFFANADRILEKKYVPTNEDIVRMRKSTIGINETVVNFGDVSFRLVDVGGQRTERKKWIHCFEGVSSVIFIASLAEYNQSLVEDPSANRLLESIALFKTIFNIPWIEQTSVILFLNKRDIFKEKIKYFKLKDTFEDYMGEERDFSQAKQFIMEKFTEVAQAYR